MSAAFDFNSLDARQLEQILEIEKIYVKYPRVANALAQISECRESSKIAREPQSMLFVGAPGVGKTSIIDTYMQQNPTVKDDERLRIPVFKAAIPSGATLRSVAEALLTEIGAPNPSSGSRAHMTNRLVTLLRENGTELIILDEFQHLLQDAAAKNVPSICDWIKMVIDQTHVPMLLVGVPEVGAIVRSNEQLMRRIHVQLELAPFGWMSDGVEYRGFLKAFEKRLPFPDESRLFSTETGMRIFAASGGVAAATMKLVRGAARVAVAERRPRIDDALLSISFEKHLRFSSKLRFNPFAVEMREVRDAVIGPGPARLPAVPSRVTKAAPGSSLHGEG